MWRGVLQFPLDNTVNVCAYDTRVVDRRLLVCRIEQREVRKLRTQIPLCTTKATKTAKAVHTEHTLNNAHFHGLTKHVCSVCLGSHALSTLPPQGNMAQCGFICAQVYSRL